MFQYQLYNDIILLAVLFVSTQSNVSVVHKIYNEVSVCHAYHYHYYNNNNNYYYY